MSKRFIPVTGILAGLLLVLGGLTAQAHHCVPGNPNHNNNCPPGGGGGDPVTVTLTDFMLGLVGSGSGTQTSSTRAEADGAMTNFDIDALTLIDGVDASVVDAYNAECALTLNLDPPVTTSSNWFIVRNPEADNIDVVVPVTDVNEDKFTLVLSTFDFFSGEVFPPLSEPLLDWQVNSGNKGKKCRAGSYDKQGDSTGLGTINVDLAIVPVQ